MGKLVPIRTKRLVLRSWRRSDVEEYDEGCNTPAVMRWLGGVRTRAAIRREVDYFRAAEARDGFTFWAAERRSDKRLLGFCGLLKITERDCPFRGAVEIGWRIREDAWRRGYAFEAATAVLRVAADLDQLNVIVSRAAAGNKPSRSLMAKLGMRRRRESDYQPRGETVKLLVYELTPSTDWLRRQPEGENLVPTE